jgi:hypothetical protein
MNLAIDRTPLARPARALRVAVAIALLSALRVSSAQAAIPGPGGGDPPMLAGWGLTFAIVLLLGIGFYVAQRRSARG